MLFHVVVVTAVSLIPDPRARARSPSRSLALPAHSRHRQPALVHGRAEGDGGRRPERAPRLSHRGGRGASSGGRGPVDGGGALTQRLMEEGGKHACAANALARKCFTSSRATCAWTLSRAASCARCTLKRARCFCCQRVSRTRPRCVCAVDPGVAQQQRSTDLTQCWWAGTTAVPGHAGLGARAGAHPGGGRRHAVVHGRLWGRPLRGMVSLR